MKIIYFQSSLEEFRSGVWFYRQYVPARELRNRGHDIRMTVLVDKVDSGWENFPDVAIFRGCYAYDPVPLMRRLKRIGKRVVYDIDDDFMAVNPDNPARAAAKEKTQQIIVQLIEADIITTTTEILRKRLLQFNKNIVVVPNALDFTEFRERPRTSNVFKIGYTGGASHWGDLELIVDVLIELQKKYQFQFILQGFTGGPLVNDIYAYTYFLKQGIQPEKKEYYEVAIRTFEKLRGLNYLHIPWYHPELYPEILRGLDLDVGLCPLKNNTFNRAKSCIKFYEFSAIGSAVLASDVLPYKEEVNYRAKNTFKDWYKKLEKLIKDEKFREKIAEKQWRFVEENRNIKNIVVLWEKALGYIK